MAILLDVSIESDYRLRFTINNNTDAPVLIDKENFEIRNVLSCSPNTTKPFQCNKLKSTLETEISLIEASLELIPNQPYSFSISLLKLKDHPYFYDKTPCFNIRIKITGNQPVSRITKVFQLTWPPLDDNKIMLEYRDTQPFYLNVAESSTLRLWITGSDQNALINNADSQPTLNATPIVEFLETQADSELCQNLVRQFNLSKIKLSKKDNDTLMTVPIENPQANINQETSATLKITFTPEIYCEIPVLLLQRSAFPGHVAIDFGTTNSAIAYYDPNDGIPQFPNRTFSESQLDKLNTVIVQLMDEVERQAVKDYSYQDTAQQLVHFATMMWTNDPQANQVESISDIKQHFVRLQHRQVDKEQIGEWQAKLLVSWGVIGYNRLKTNGSSLAVLNFVAQQYFNALNRIIDIDLKKDAKLGLPELDPGQRDGTIPSDIIMQELSTLNDTKQVDGLHSKIDMGHAIKINRVKDSGLDELPNLPQDGKEKHKLYLSGAKRGLGLKETSYFIDGENQVFVDTYDPLCTAAIKELFIRTEKFINDGRDHLNNVVVTYPANLPQYRREAYRKMMQNLGIAHVDMSFDEATAGALYYVWRELFKDLFAGIDGFLARSRVRQEKSLHPVTGESRQVNFYYQNILLYDLGGGTTDISLLEIGLKEIEDLLPSTQRNSGRYFIISPKILGLTGQEDFGGDNVTLAVFRILKSKLASTAAQLLSEKLKTEGRRNDYSPTVQEALDAFALGQPNSDIFTEWFAEHGDKKYDKQVDIKPEADGIPAKQRNLPDLIDALVTTRFELKPELQSLFFGLWQEAERIKQVLSTPPEGYEEIPLPSTVTAAPQNLLPAIKHLDLEISEMELGNISITAQEMERLVEKDIERTFEKARNLCIDGNIKEGYTTKYFIDRLVLAGSGSHLRLVREHMPREILSKAFDFKKAGQIYKNLSAPFKPDGYNLNFTPEDAKLAVVRGACLPRYFTTTRVSPSDPQLMSLLNKGLNFLDFDVDNLRNYMPFSLIYAVGHDKDILFESGDKMLETSRTGKPAIRKRIPEMEGLNCYRVDNAAQMDNAVNEQYYAKFNIRDAVLKIDEDKNSFSKYLFWVEFDIERDIKCFMYTKKAGNDNDNYINQTANIIEKDRISNAIQTLVDTQEEEWKFKPNITLWYPVGMSKEQLQLQQVSSTLVEGTVIFQHARENKGGITRFAFSEDSAPLWQIDLQNYSVNNHESSLVQPELQIQLELEQEQLNLKYTVYDPDLTGDNVQEIEMSHDSSRAKPPFNPYRGEE